MLQGTASNVGKSLLATAFCRILYEDGYKVSPFKSWNMALNSYITEEGAEIGRAQGEQAEASNIQATADMNPVLIKPSGDRNAQVIIHGRPIGSLSLKERTSQEIRKIYLQAIQESLARLKDLYEIIVIEGAGSPAEINLGNQDVANMVVAKMVQAPVFLVADVEKGGSLASVVGTIKLLSEEDKERVKGIIFNKFRGDKSLFESAITIVEEKTGVPVLGLIPFQEECFFAAEDSVALMSTNHHLAKEPELKGLTYTQRKENSLQEIAKNVRNAINMDLFYKILNRGDSID